MRFFAKHGLLAAMLLALTLPGCGNKTGTGKDGKDGKGGNGGGTEVDHSSPEKVAESFKAAAKEKDWKTMFACLTDESKKTLLIGPLIGAGFTTMGDKDKKESLDALLKKHGIDPTNKKGPDEDPTAGVKDQGALFADLMDWLDKNTPKRKGEKPRKSMSERIASTEFANFKTDGDTATADVMHDGKKEDAAEFKKIDGKWYLHLDTKRKRAPKFPKN